MQVGPKTGGGLEELETAVKVARVERMVVIFREHAKPYPKGDGLAGQADFPLGEPLVDLLVECFGHGMALSWLFVHPARGG